MERTSFSFYYGDSDICVSPSQFLFLNNELIINNVISILYSLIGDGYVDCGFGILCVIKVKIVFLNEFFIQMIKNFVVIIHIKNMF